MSGRKEWEVASVLEEAEKTLKKRIYTDEKDIDEKLKKIKENNNEITNNKKIILNISADNMPNSDKEFPNEIGNIRKSLNNIHNSVREYYEINTSNFEQEKEEIINEINSNNEKAHNLREKIRNRSHYLTAEYNEAKKIVSELKKLKFELNDIKNKVNNAYNEGSQTVKQISAQKRGAAELEKNIDQLENKAKKIRGIRQKAGKLKEQVQSDMEKIDKKHARKFLNANFERLNTDAKQLYELPDKIVIERFKKINLEINKFIVELNEKYSKWLAEKEASGKLLENVEVQGVKKEIILLEDKAEGINRKISKIAFYDHYMKTNKEKEFIEMIKKAKSYLENEEFQRCNDLLRKSNDFYESVVTKSDNIRERIETAFNFTIKIRNIMSHDIHFNKVAVDILDENPLNGFTLKCENGDTIIFDEIKIDENGSPIVKLNHIENTGGTCGPRWSDMQKVFNEKGIPLMDVKKNGSSVIYKDNRHSSKSGNKKQQQNKRRK